LLKKTRNILLFCASTGSKRSRAVAGSTFNACPELAERVQMFKVSKQKTGERIGSRLELTHIRDYLFEPIS
jgi:hypothetical protein